MAWKTAGRSLGEGVLQSGLPAAASCSRGVGALRPSRFGPSHMEYPCCLSGFFSVLVLLLNTGFTIFQASGRSCLMVEYTSHQSFTARYPRTFIVVAARDTLWSQFAHYAMCLVHSTEGVSMAGSSTQNILIRQAKSISDIKI